MDINMIITLLLSLFTGVFFFTQHEEVAETTHNNRASDSLTDRKTDMPLILYNNMLKIHIICNF